MSAPPLPPLFIVFNAASGSQDALAASARVAELLQAAGQPHVLHLVRQAPELGALAVRAVHEARAAGGIVVAAGGDGTVSAVAQAVFNAGLPLAVLPRGTFNYFAREHGMPDGLHEAVAALLAARPRAVPVGMVNGRLFLVSASVGLYPRVLLAREAAKARFGRHRLTAMLSGLVTLLRGGGRLTLQLQMTGEAEGHTRVLHARTLFVGHNALQWRMLGLPQAQAVAEGALAAISLQPLGPLPMLWLALRGAMGRLDGADGIESFSFQSLTVAPRRRLRQWPVAVDGEVHHLPAPLRFEAAPRPLQVWLPPAPSAPPALPAD
ncbi:MAG: diacylglycerol kinase family protein [Comamonadaceae bacterium]|nr:diacylglycerol kinase family protein [Comamonadaceae bacterium]